MITSNDKNDKKLTAMLLQTRVSELEQIAADNLARIAELDQQLANRKGISMIAAISERVIKATNRLITDDSGAMDVITKGQKHLAFIHSIKPVDIHHKLRVCLETNNLDVTTEELSDIKEYLAALLSGQFAFVKSHYDAVMGLFFREIEQAADSGHNDVDWNNLLRSVNTDIFNLLMVKTHYFAV